MKATVNLERRYMEANLTGAEASRLVAAELADYSPYGPVATWQTGHSYRRLLEVQAFWRCSCMQRGVRPTEALWNAIVEAAYSRALEEQPAESTNHHDEVVFLDDKIAFWRAQIPVAAGGAPAGNMLELQRAMQLQGAAADDPPEVLSGDLVGWRQTDLGAWIASHPAAAPSAP